MSYRETLQKELKMAEERRDKVKPNAVTGTGTQEWSYHDGVVWGLRKALKWFEETTLSERL
jgi:hypothetical protein